MEPSITQIMEVTPLGLAALAIFFAWWVLKYKKNGNGYSGLKDELTSVRSNHLTHIQSDITRLLQGQAELIKYQEKQIYILEEIKQSLINHK